MDEQWEPLPRCLHRYTVVLAVFGVLSLISAIATHVIADFAVDPGMLRFWRVADAGFGGMLLLVAALRALDAQISGEATAAVSLLLAFSVPAGTAVFTWWVFRVLPRERDRGVPVDVFD